MKAQDITIDIDEYTFHCTITDYVYQAPLGPSACSDYDCYGYEEVEWECDYAETYDEDGNLVVANVLIGEYSDRIEQKILDEIHEMQDNVDYDEPDDY